VTGEGYLFEGGDKDMKRQSGERVCFDWDMILSSQVYGTGGTSLKKTQIKGKFWVKKDYRKVWVVYKGIR